MKTSINKLSKGLHRVIVEHEKLEIDYWGNTIDHKNNNSLDNRSSNLRIYNSKLNTTNIKRKFDGIHRQHGGGYKVHINIFDEVVYKNFETKKEAQGWFAHEATPYIEAKIIEMIKKTRDIEFERGLRDKLNNNEKEEVLKNTYKIWDCLVDMTIAWVT